ncbi:MAG: phosphoethanolamine transferase, partial [Parvibaculum sp.]|uniref:phosphoethanolamine transferase domain-containing protein n=1 Tax=Parvibaculum sp. TaxID=2024848 RepID=UPI001B1CD560
MRLSSLTMALLQRLAALRLPAVHPLLLALGVSCLFVLFYNGQLWSAVLGWWPGRSFRDIAFLASIGLFLAIAFNLVLQPFAFPRVLKPVLVCLILAAAGVSWFASSYGALMDRGMIANVLGTDAREVGDLLNPGFLLHMVLFGLLPALLVVLVPLRPAGFWRETVLRGGTVLGSVALVGLIAAFNPSAAIYASLRHATDAREGLAAKFERIADHVERGPEPASPGGRKKVLVFVVGETARADHFSLNGYERDTNPELARRGVVSFADVRSCAT